MMATMLGPVKFRAATDLYFDRFDGTAATCEDFVACMEEAGGVDLSQFRLWYSQAGTPRVSAGLSQEPGGGRAELRLAQHVPATPGQSVKQPMVLPLKIRLFGAETGRPLTDETLILLDQVAETVTFEAITERPVLSINRGFRPIVIESDRTAEDLAFLSAHDDDPFARYEAMQQLMLDTLVAGTIHGAVKGQAVIDAVTRTLEAEGLELAFLAEAVLLPSENFIGDQLAIVDPDAIHAAREELRTQLGQALLPTWRRLYAELAQGSYVYSPEAKGRRRLRNVALGYIAASGAEDAAALAFAQFEAADNMTDRQAALTTLVHSDAPNGKRRWRISMRVMRITGWCSTSGSRPRRCRRAPIPARWSSSWSGIPTSRWPIPIGHGRCWGVRGEPARVQLRRRLGLSLPGRPADRTRPAQPADRRQAAAAARPLAPVRRQAFRPDARRAGADRRDAGPVQGSVRTGLESLD